MEPRLNTGWPIKPYILIHRVSAIVKEKSKSVQQNVHKSGEILCRSNILCKLVQSFPSPFKTLLATVHLI